VFQTHLLRGLNVDERQFRDLYHQYAGRLYTYALWITRNRDSSQDIIQSIFVKLWQYDELALEGKALDAWLYRITRNACIDFFRKCARNFKLRLRYSREFTRYGAETAEQKSVWDALDMVSEKERAILFLFFHAGYSHKEIAGMLNMQETNVRVISFRALEKLRKKYVGKIV
jgi:RNA polymerase sigma-70 factor (ECF subfamily)